MKVTLVDSLGTDLTVVNAARVSFAKKADWERPFEGNQEIKFLSDKDEKLIRYLAKNNHWTPFGHAQVQLHVKAPIFVARQLVKHQVGLVWNEVSRRYVDDTPEFWWPEEWRLRAENKKQGSSDEVLDNVQKEYVNNQCRQFETLCKSLYSDLLGQKIAPEMARVVLPLNLYTEWYWTGSLAAWARVCKLRLDPHAQKECQDIAKQIDPIMRKLFPVSWEALLGGTNE